MGSKVIFAVAISLWMFSAAARSESPFWKTYWVDDGNQPIRFTSEAKRGTEFGAKLKPSQSFILHRVISEGIFSGDYEGTSDDGTKISLTKQEFRDRLTLELWKAADKSKQRIYLTPPDRRTAKAIDKAAGEHKAAVKAAAATERSSAIAQRAAWIALPEAKIGMTSTEVINSRRGVPSHKNRTQSAAGMSEQWVYDGSSFLYFVNGYLTTIQTTQ